MQLYGSTTSPYVRGLRLWCAEQQQSNRVKVTI